MHRSRSPSSPTPAASNSDRSLSITRWSPTATRRCARDPDLGAGLRGADALHPYTELLFIIEGEADVWLQGEQDTPHRLKAAICVALPPDIPHSFRTVGDKPMKLLGIHANATRISTYLDRETDRRRCIRSSMPT